MPQDVEPERLDVVRRDVGPTAEEGQGLGGAEEEDRRAG